MVPKKNRKQAQETMLEEPVEDRVIPLESIGEEELRTQKDQEPGRTKMSPKVKKSNRARSYSPRNN